MSKKTFTVIHDLSKLDAQQTHQYLRDASEFIGLDPDLGALDTIWMQNESGPGQSLVVYARRGTAEILRNQLGIEVSSLTNQEIRGSIVFTATGKNKAGRQEIATGSKDISKVNGKALDDAIMTASTRALRRLTMQFTSLGILDESEVKATVGDTTNPAAGAALAGSPVVIPPVPTVANNAPGKDVTPVPAPLEPRLEGTISASDFAARQQEMRDEATRQLAEKAAKQAAISPAAPVSTPVETTQNSETEVATNPAKPKRARKSKNTVSLEGGPEPEVVNNTPPDDEIVKRLVAETPGLVPVQVPTIVAPLIPDNAPVTAVLTPVAPVAAPAVPVDNFAGKPSVEQMADYRKRVSVYTSQLPSSENLGSVQKMRAFITKMSGNPPQYMTVDQWDEILGWFTEFENRNKIGGLIKYINDSLGVK